MLCSRVRGQALVLFFSASLYGPAVSQVSPPPASAPSAEVTLRIIVVSSREKAEQILDQLRQGQDFPMLAKQESSDSTAEEGGLIGRVDSATLRTELREALRAVGPDKISPIARTPLGYAILEPDTLPTRSEGAKTGANAATVATGSVKLMFNVGGLPEVELGFGRFPKEPGWAQDLSLICQTRKNVVSRQKDKLDKLKKDLVAATDLNAKSAADAPPFCEAPNSVRTCRMPTMSSTSPSYTG